MSLKFSRSAVLLSLLMFLVSGCSGSTTPQPSGKINRSTPVVQAQITPTATPRVYVFPNTVSKECTLLSVVRVHCILLPGYQVVVAACYSMRVKGLHILLFHNEPSIDTHTARVQENIDIVLGSNPAGVRACGNYAMIGDKRLVSQVAYYILQQRSNLDCIPYYNEGVYKDCVRR